MFIALLFLPLMRWLGKRKVPKVISVFIVFLLIIGGLNIGIELVQLSNKEIMATDAAFFNKAENKLNNLIFYIEDTFGVKLKQDKNLLSQLIEKENIGSIIDF